MHKFWLQFLLDIGIVILEYMCLLTEEGASSMHELKTEDYKLEISKFLVLKVYFVFSYNMCFVF